MPTGSSGPGAADLERELRRLAVDGRISCRAAFGLAGRLSVSVSRIGRAADDLGIKIVACQLGCFP